MVKISQKLFLMLILSTTWSQIEFAPFEAPDNSTHEASDYLQKQKKELEQSRTKNFIERMKIEHNLTDKSSNDEIRTAYNKERNSFYQAKGLFSAKSKEESNYSIDNFDTYLNAHLREAEIAKERERTQTKRELIQNFEDTIKSITDLKNLTGSDLLEVLQNEIQDLRPARFNPTEFQNLLNNKILDLSTDELSKINPSFIKILTTQTLTKLTSDQIKAFTTEQMNALSPEQLKAIFSKSELIGALEPEQIKAIEPQTLANAVLGITFPFKFNHLPNSFVDAMTPEQAKIIMDHEKMGKSTVLWRFFNKYFSKTQQDYLRSLADKIDNNYDTIHAQRLAQIFAHTGKLNQEDTQKLLDILSLVTTTSEKQSVINAFIKIVGTSKSVYDQKSLIKEFFTNFVQDTLEDHEWPIEFHNKSNGHYGIEIVDMGRIDPTKSIAEQYKKLQSDGTLTKYKDGYISIDTLQKEYGRWLINKINLNENFIPQINEQIITNISDTTADSKFSTVGSGIQSLRELNPAIAQSIESALTEKINTELKNNQINIEDLNLSYLTYIDLTNLTSEQLQDLVDTKIFNFEQIKISYEQKNSITTLLSKYFDNLLYAYRYTSDPAQIFTFFKNTAQVKNPVIQELINQFLIDNFYNKLVPEYEFEPVNIRQINKNGPILYMFHKILGNETALTALQDNLKTFSSDQLENLKNLKVSELTTIIDQLHTQNISDNVSEPESESVIPNNQDIIIQIDKDISTQQELSETITEDNAAHVGLQIMQLADKTTKTLDQNIADIQRNWQKNLATLGLRFNATREQIGDSYKKLALRYHPDILPKEMSLQQRTVAENKFKDISAAYTDLTKDLPEKVAQLAIEIHQEQKLITDLQTSTKSKGITLTTKQQQGFDGILMTLATLPETYSDILGIQPETIAPNPKTKIPPNLSAERKTKKK